LNQQVQFNTSENVEEYLEALWLSEEKGHPIAKISWVAKQLAVAPPSVFEMFKKLESRGLVQYYAYKGIRMTDTGRHIAQRVVRNHRLVEVLMHTTLRMDVDEPVACGIEHHMSEQFTDALCTLLNHPNTCPHGNTIPPGRCCNSKP
jgi:DtxR family Mn-dependent transcriptional regulator